MKLFKYIMLTILGMFVFSVFVTCVYEGGFETVIQNTTGTVLLFIAGLGWFVMGIIKVYENTIGGNKK